MSPSVQEPAAHIGFFNWSKVPTCHPELKDVAQLVNQRNADNAEANLRHSGQETQSDKQLSD